ncbi:endonuclease/exonuclease/phosphatase family protein [Rehaibacterium terrae]|uniref:Endonuclease/exonuclease/phosphatase family metal-dependent hydrolase n=1 Tax=Rehaibacterium terrae TaxID=1341696 RepID=A0A7W7XY78_9GAMM|nr:endonuclease/exonuclease/phosphatase family protein [Rehaibacterium terrae]MBB5014255.1 endonuclease/exonuclease/phosphatase family metal-dependent hydrolase [Rehaibacterium terrae]
MRTLVLVLSLALLAACGRSPDTATDEAAVSEPPVPTVRFATYNVSLYSTEPGGLIARLEAGDEGARKIAAVIQRQRPDVLLLNEFDYDADHRAAGLFQRDYLEVGQHGEQPIRYAYRYLAPVNTGVPSGLDLDRDGRSDGPADAWGFGHQPGQYGMLVLSRHPIDAAAVRSFQHFRWKDLPDALEPQVPETGAPWYPPQVWEQLRLSSKSHWDVPVDTPLGRVHFLVSHPTPPVFDGPEDRNGRRNHDEIRLWAEYVSDQPLEWLYDDAGRRGGLDRDALFVIAGDLNADPVDGDSVPGAIQQLLDHPRVQRYPAPRSEGAVIAAETTGEANLAHRGDHAHDTGNFGPRVGNLRIDYVLPSVGLQVRDSGVFWPRPDEPGHDWTLASDHHMVWVDVVLEQAR